jgi:hypothetical protein
MSICTTNSKDKEEFYVRRVLRYLVLAVGDLVKCILLMRGNGPIIGPPVWLSVVTTTQLHLHVRLCL